MNTETKTKQPYIPLYIGDWEQDTNCLTLEAEGALLKLIFKLWKSDDKGRAEFSFTQLSILLKNTEEITRKIVSELHENKILSIEFVGKDRVKFASRRILKEIAKSLTYSENGSKGGRPKKANQKLTKSKTKAKPKQNPDNDSDNDYESVNENRKGGMGEKQKPIHPGVIEVIHYLNELNGTNFRTDTKATLKLIEQRFAEGFPISELKEIIEYKVAEWKGTSQDKWLQPDTLFNGENCAKYRNQVQAAKDKGMSITQIRARQSGPKSKEEMLEEFRIAQAKKYATQ